MTISQEISLKYMYVGQADFENHCAHHANQPLLKTKKQNLTLYNIQLNLKCLQTVDKGQKLQPSLIDILQIYTPLIIS